METKLYFAYGMNLNHAHMATACPTAVPIGARKIQGYRLVFRRYADIVESEEDCVWGGCWEIDAAAEYVLDGIEGYPDLYRKLVIDGMMVYQMNESGYPEMEPSPDYVEMIREGLVDFDLSPETLEQNLGKGRA